MKPRTAAFLLQALSEIEDAETLNKIVRKCNRQLKKMGADTPPATPIKPSDVKEGDKLVIGTERGQQTKVKVVKVNRKRLKVELLEDRGRKKVTPKGTTIDIYPDMLRARL